MEQFAPITLRKGATTVLQVDLTSFDMQGGFVVLTISDNKYTPLRSWKTDEQKLWTITIPDEFTSGLRVSKECYFYDVMWHLGDERFAQCAPSHVLVEATVGGYPYDPAEAK